MKSLSTHIQQNQLWKNLVKVHVLQQPSTPVSQFLSQVMQFVDKSLGYFTCSSVCRLQCFFPCVLCLLNCMNLKQFSHMHHTDYSALSLKVCFRRVRWLCLQQAPVLYFVHYLFATLNDHELRGMLSQAATGSWKTPFTLSFWMFQAVKPRITVTAKSCPTLHKSRLCVQTLCKPLCSKLNCIGS